MNYQMYSILLCDIFMRDGEKSVCDENKKLFESFQNGEQTKSSEFVAKLYNSPVRNN